MFSFTAILSRRRTRRLDAQWQLRTLLINYMQAYKSRKSARKVRKTRKMKYKKMGNTEVILSLHSSSSAAKANFRAINLQLVHARPFDCDVAFSKFAEK